MLFTIIKNYTHKHNIIFNQRHIHLLNDGNILQVHIQKEFMRQKFIIFPVFFYASFFVGLQFSFINWIF